MKKILRAAALGLVVAAGVSCSSSKVGDEAISQWAVAKKFADGYRTQAATPAQVQTYLDQNAAAWWNVAVAEGAAESRPAK